MSGIEPRRAVHYEEQSAHTGWRKVLFWQPGELAKVKRRTNRRERRERRDEARELSRAEYWEPLPVLDHEHWEIDAGGNCRDPLCGYNTDIAFKTQGRVDE